MNNTLIFAIIFFVVLFVFRIGYYFGTKDYEEFVSEEIEFLRQKIEELASQEKRSS